MCAASTLNEADPGSVDAVLRFEALVEQFITNSDGKELQFESDMVPYQVGPFSSAGLLVTERDAHTCLRTTGITLSPAARQKLAVSTALAPLVHSG